MQRRLQAVFVRGGTSRALVFHRRDLPGDRGAWDPIFLAALGSPDPNGRQLDGLGGGISSLSKVAVVGPATRTDADVDYTFGQVEVTRAAVDYRGNCGNISSAIGPFAIDEGLIPARAPVTVVRIHNTNTGKLIHAHVAVDGGRAAVKGDFVLDGVPGTGSRVALDFLDPGGAVTGRLLPTGQVKDTLEVPGLGTLTATLVDATNPMVFVAAKDLGLDGTERPDELDDRPGLPARLEAIRAAGAVRMGLARTPEEASRSSAAVPKIALLAAPAAYRTLAGATIEPHAMDLLARMVSMGKAHRAFALTGAMCLAVAARIPGTVAQEAAALAETSGDVRIGHASGVLPVAAAVESGAGGSMVAQTVTVYRTARRLMEGFVLVP
jgi:2-methylaconitate cis-trans-isomerase PrpF